MFKHILLVTAGSPTSEHAARPAVDLAVFHSAHLTALQVQVAPADGFVPRRARAPAVLEQALAGGREWLDAAQAARPARGHPRLHAAADGGPAARPRADRRDRDRRCL